MIETGNMCPCGKATRQSCQQQSCQYQPTGQEISRRLSAYKRASLHLECALFAEQLQHETRYANARVVLAAVARMFREWSDQEATDVIRHGIQ